MVDNVLANQVSEETEELTDTSDAQQINKKKKKEARTRADRLHFIEAAMKHPQGRSWFYDTLVACKVVGTPFRSDPYETAFNCGMQNIGLRILSDIQTAAPDEYITMIRENQ